MKSANVWGFSFADVWNEIELRHISTLKELEKSVSFSFAGKTCFFDAQIDSQFKNYAKVEEFLKSLELEVVPDNQSDVSSFSKGSTSSQSSASNISSVMDSL